MGQRSAREWKAADSLAGLQGPDLGDDSAFTQVRHQQVETAELQVAAENSPDPRSLGFVDGYLALLRVIAERRHAADPKPLAFGGGDLVPDTLRGDLALELGK